MILLIDTVHGQKFSVETEAFDFVVLDESISLLFMEDVSNMVVFDGYPIESISAEVTDGILIIETPKEHFKNFPTIVIRYDKHRQPPVGLNTTVAIIEKCGPLEELPVRTKM